MAPNDLSTCADRQCLRAGHKVRMDVRFYGIGDLQTPLFRHPQVDIVIATRIDYRSHCRFAVADQVGNLRQAIRINRLENEPRYLR
jgi:hypothetical protein